MIYGISKRIIAMVATGLLILALLAFGLRQCDKRRDAAAQARMDKAQAEARAESSADAINTVSRSGEAAAASEELTRNNERDIRAAEGASERVGAGVNTAGRRALCKRAAYKDDPKCAIFRSGQ